MTLDQARHIMDQQFGPNPPRFGDWQTAALTISRYYDEHPEELMPTSFATLTLDQSAMPRLPRGPSGLLDRPGTRDQRTAFQPFERPSEWLREEARGARLDESWANVQGPETKNPGMITGADLVQNLDGDASSYFISVDPVTRKAGLYKYRLPHIDPGQVGRSDGTVARTTDRGPSYYQSLARLAETQRRVVGVQLREMNRQNREGWANRNG